MTRGKLSLVLLAFLVGLLYCEIGVMNHFQGRVVEE